MNSKMELNWHILVVLRTQTLTHGRNPRSVCVFNSVFTYFATDFKRCQGEISENTVRYGLSFQQYQKKTYELMTYPPFGRVIYSIRPKGPRYRITNYRHISWNFTKMIMIFHFRKQPVFLRFFTSFAYRESPSIHEPPKDIWLYIHNERSCQGTGADDQQAKKLGSHTMPNRTLQMYVIWR